MGRSRSSGNAERIRRWTRSIREGPCRGCGAAANKAGSSDATAAARLLDGDTGASYRRELWQKAALSAPRVPVSHGISDGGRPLRSPAHQQFQDARDDRRSWRVDVGRTVGERHAVGPNCTFDATHRVNPLTLASRAGGECGVLRVARDVNSRAINEPDCGESADTLSSSLNVPCEVPRAVARVACYRDQGARLQRVSPADSACLD
jgi:hypothetical protein